MKLTKTTKKTIICALNLPLEFNDRIKKKKRREIFKEETEVVYFTTDKIPSLKNGLRPIKSKTLKNYFPYNKKTGVAGIRFDFNACKEIFEMCYGNGLGLEFCFSNYGIAVLNRHKIVPESIQNYLTMSCGFFLEKINKLRIKSPRKYKQFLNYDLKKIEEIAENSLKQAKLAADGKIDHKLNKKNQKFLDKSLPGFSESILRKMAFPPEMVRDYFRNPVLFKNRLNEKLKNGLIEELFLSYWTVLNMQIPQGKTVYDRINIENYCKEIIKYLKVGFSIKEKLKNEKQFRKYVLLQFKDGGIKGTPN